MGPARTCAGCRSVPLLRRDSRRLLTHPHTSSAGRMPTQPHPRWTPPWCEHAPRRPTAEEGEPSRQLAPGITAAMPTQAVMPRITGRASSQARGFRGSMVFIWSWFAGDALCQEGGRMGDQAAPACLKRAGGDAWSAEGAAIY